MPQVPVPMAVIIVGWAVLLQIIRLSDRIKNIENRQKEPAHRGSTPQ